MNLPRQPEIVKVMLEGNKIDCEKWCRKLMQYAENQAAAVERIGSPQHSTIFRIVPFAVND